MRYSEEQYGYITAYPDELLVFINYPIGILRVLNALFTLKAVGGLDLYLGGDLITA